MLIDPHLNPYTLEPEALVEALIEASLDGAVVTCTHSARDARRYVDALRAEDFVALYGVELLTSHGALLAIPREANDAFLKARWAPEGDEIAPEPAPLKVGRGAGLTGYDHAEEDHAGEDLEGEDPAGEDHAGEDHAGEGLTPRATAPRWRLEALLSRLSGFDGVVVVCHPFSRLSSTAWGDRAYTLQLAHAAETRVGRGLAVRDFLCDQLVEQRGWARLGSCGADLNYLGSAATVLPDEVDSQRALCDALLAGACWPVEFERLDHPRARYQEVMADEGPRHETLEQRERREALSEVNRRRGAPIDEIFRAKPSIGHVSRRPAGGERGPRGAHGERGAHGGAHGGARGERGERGARGGREGRR
jgi:hypothetical protein